MPHTNCNAYQSRLSDQGICRLENSQRLIQYLSGEGPAAPCSYQGAECAGDLYAQNSMVHVRTEQYGPLTSENVSCQMLAGSTCIIADTLSALYLNNLIEAEDLLSSQCGYQQSLTTCLSNCTSTCAPRLGFPQNGARRPQIGHYTSYLVRPVKP